MASRKRNLLSLQEASDHAWQHGLIGNYYALDSDTTASLRELLTRTRWRQSVSSLQQGHGKLYAFHQALRRLRPKPRDLRALQRASERATILAARAHRLRNIAYAIGDRASYREAADTFEITAEAYEEANNMHEAVKARRNAKVLRQFADAEMEPDRDPRKRRPTRARRR